MSSFAFKDIKRTIRIEADEALKNDNSILYYCPNPHCDARMHIVQGLTPYFAAKKKSPHDDYCPYSADTIFYPGKYDENSFDFLALQRIILGEGSRQSRGLTSRSQYQDHKHSVHLGIRTLSVLYNMCKYKGIDDTYNNVPIKDILFDSRCTVDSIRGFKGFKVIECQSKTPRRLDYYSSECRIQLFGPIYNYNRVTFNLYFERRDVYSWVRTRLFNNRDKLFAVAGQWQPTKDGQGFDTFIQNRKQVIIIK